MPLPTTVFPTPEKVAYLQGDSNYTRIHLINGERQFWCMTLLRILSTHYPSFFRVHKAYAVNPLVINREATYSSPSVVIQVGRNTTTLPVARRRRKDLEDFLSEPLGVIEQ